MIRELARRLRSFGGFLYPKHRGVPETNVPLLVERLRARPLKGALLEVGGGRAPYRPLLATLPLAPYVVLDIRGGSVTGDAHALPIATGSAGVVTLFEVLEHLSDPLQAFKEVSRVLAPGGMLVLTVPQYWHVHGHPSDYWRFTCHGLRHLCARTGLTVVELWPMAGPGILCSQVLVLTFGLDRDPIRRLLFGVPLTWMGFLLDLTFFRGFMRWENPDTRGWALMARKGEASAT
ncbi:class I SAM-dependent methyltransferase [bacterium]|nr:class I SAM-dependent methyltransferase [bacterium]